MNEWPSQGRHDCYNLLSWNGPLKVIQIYQPTSQRTLSHPIRFWAFKISTWLFSDFGPNCNLTVRKLISYWSTLTLFHIPRLMEGNILSGKWLSKLMCDKCSNRGCYGSTGAGVLVSTWLGGAVWGHSRAESWKIKKLRVQMRWEEGAGSSDRGNFMESWTCIHGK